MPLVYLETSLISACVTTRTDAASIYRRDASNEWWRSESSKHDLVVSAEVTAELRHPDFQNSDKALVLIKGVDLLDIDARVLGVAALFVRDLLMPGPAVSGDAIHVAACAVHGVDYLLTWNVRHLANQNKLTHLKVLCQRLGLVPPTIITPDLLWQFPAGPRP